METHWYRCYHIAVREGRVVWDNLRKIIHINTCINNAQGLSVLFGLAFGLHETILTAIQVLFSNLICAVTLGFVCAIGMLLDTALFILQYCIAVPTIVWLALTSCF